MMQKHTSRFIYPIAAILLLAISSCNHTKQHPNLIFIFSEPHGYQSSINNETRPTPNIDNFAKVAIRFTHCFSISPLSTPYRGMLMSGQHPLYNGCYQNDAPLIPGRGKKFGEALSDEGYNTAYIGKWHLLGGKGDRPIPPGEKRYGFNQLFISNNCYPENYSGPDYFWNEEGKKLPYKQSAVSGQTAQAIEYIRSTQNSPDPFALFLSFEPAVSDSSLSQIDKAFGLIVDQLKKIGAYENSVIVYTSTFGRATEHANLSDYMKDKTLRVPFILRYPEMQDCGTSTSLLMSSMDIMPTLLGLLNIKVPKQAHGRNLTKPILKRNEEAVQSLPLFLYSKNGFWGVVTKDYTYGIEAKDSTSESFALFDRTCNPHQEYTSTTTFGNDSIINALHTKTIQWMEYFEDSRYGYREIGEIMPHEMWSTQGEDGIYARPIDKLKKLHGLRIMHFHGNNNYD